MKFCLCCDRKSGGSRQIAKWQERIASIAHSHSALLFAYLIGALALEIDIASRFLGG